MEAIERISEAEGAEQIAQAIIERPSNFGWNLNISGYPNPLQISSHTAATEENVKAAEQFFGPFEPSPHGSNHKIIGHKLASQFVHRLFADAVRLDRLGYLNRVAKIQSCAGMGSRAPRASLAMMFLPKTVHQPKYRNVPDCGMLNVRVDWWGEKSVTLNVVELARDGGAIFELYLWRGCDHDHKGEQRGNCYHVYTCAKCGDRYEIDSGD